MKTMRLLEMLTSERKLRAIQRLASHGATDGEKAAAKDALERLKRRTPNALKPDWERLYNKIKR